MMTPKYKKHEIFDYIRGSEIDEKRLDELEKDENFMIEVIRFTRDINLYRCCDEEVKNSSKFVKFLLEMFPDETSFLQQVGNFYLESQNIMEKSIVNMPIDSIEILILLLQKIKRSEELDFIEHALKLESFYQELRVQMEMTLIEQPNLKDELGKGFVYILDFYSQSEIIQAYFAKRMAMEIIPKENDLEKLLHQKFKTKEEAENFGIREILMDLINQEDAYLATYVTVYPQTLKELEETMEFYLKRWNRYQRYYNEEQKEKVYQELTKLTEEYELLSIEGFAILKEVITENHLEEIFFTDDFWVYLNRT